MDKELFAQLLAIEVLLGHILATQALAQSKGGLNAVRWIEVEHEKISKTLDKSRSPENPDTVTVVGLAQKTVREVIAGALQAFPQSHHDAANRRVEGKKI